MNYLFSILSVLVFINVSLIIGIIIASRCGSETIGFINARIVGGKIETIATCPFFAGILVKKGIYAFIGAEEYANEDHYICGCTIIGNYWVITAAHCTTAFNENYFPLDSGYVKSGASNWKLSRENETYMREHTIRKIVQHHEFDLERLSNDISLIKVVEPFIGKFASRIRLAGRKYNYEVGSNCTVFGFGVTSSKEYAATEQLRSVNILISNYTACQEAYDSLKDGVGLVNEWNFCAGSLEGGRDACKYDSGGPLVQNGTLIGIVSLGEDCALAKFPGIYTKISEFYSWIANVEFSMNEGTGVSFVYNS